MLTPKILGALEITDNSPIVRPIVVLLCHCAFNTVKHCAIFIVLNAYSFLAANIDVFVGCTSGPSCQLGIFLGRPSDT